MNDVEGGLNEWSDIIFSDITEMNGVTPDLLIWEVNA